MSQKLVLREQDIKVLREVFDLHKELIYKGQFEKLDREQLTTILTTHLFEFTKRLENPHLMADVRDYKAIEKYGVRQYAGQVETIHADGLMPDDVYNKFKELGQENHIGPAYLRVKGYLCYVPAVEFFARQQAFYLSEHLEGGKGEGDGWFTLVSNMTGGVWIGSYTHAELSRRYGPQKVWPWMNYARELRKVTPTQDHGFKISDYVEGPMPKPESTSVIICQEELRTACETTGNATKIYRGAGYTPEAGVEIVESCVFDWHHPVGIERLKMLGVFGSYLVDGKDLIKEANKQGYIDQAQRDTAMDWLNDPWQFTRDVMPYIKAKR